WSVLSLFAAGLVAADSPSDPAWRRHLAAAGELQRAGKFAGAASELDAALREARALGPASAAAGHELDAMGMFYSDTGNFPAAQLRLEESLRVWRARLGPDDPALARVISRLAAAYTEAGDLEAAERLDLGHWIELLRAGPAEPGEIV